MTAARVKRTPFPPLDFRCPYCPMCGEETYFEDERFCCDNCAADWPERHDEPGQPYDDGKDQCDAEVQPWADSTLRPMISGHRYRCILDMGHDGGHAGLRSDREVEHHWSVVAETFRWHEDRYPRVGDGQ